MHVFKLEAAGEPANNPLRHRGNMQNPLKVFLSASQYITTTPFSPFTRRVPSGACRRVSDEAGVGPQTVPDLERLSLRERCHQPPEPAAAIAPGGVRQETDLTTRRDRHRPV